MGVQLLQPGFDVVQTHFQLLHLGVQRIQFFHFILKGVPLVFQLGEKAAFVEAAAVFQIPQIFCQLVAGTAFVAGGHQVVQAAAEGFILGDGQIRLADKSRPAEHRLLHAQQLLAAVCRRQLRDGQPGIGFICLEFAQGDSALGASLNGDVPAVPIQVNAPRHGVARPGGVAFLVGEGGFRGFCPGVQTVEHGREKGAPGAFTPFVGGGEDVQTRLEGQLRVLQLAEGGSHFVDFHSVTSRPSSSFREISAAS